MATIDMTHRKLRFPPRFIPYLERHRIFELFHECVELLVQAKPKDHIQFLKNILPCAAMKKDKQRIVFVSPISFDRETFSLLLAECLGIRPINLMKLETLTRNKQVEEVVKIQAMSESESLEEESCICPGEYAESILPPVYYPPASEVGFGFGSPYGSEHVFPGEGGRYELGGDEEQEREHLKRLRAQEEQEGERICTDDKEEAGEGKVPCICVCPCKKREDSFERKLRERKLELEEERRKEEAMKEGRDLEGLGKGRGRHRKGGASSGYADSDLYGEGEGSWRFLPCPPVKHKTKKRERAKTEQTPYWMSPVLSGSVIEIDFGILKECDLAAKGWILEDFPVTEMEAEKLNALGVIPTHALRIIVDEEEEDRNRDYKVTVKGWMKAYKYVPVMEIRVNGRSLPDLVKDMCSLLSMMPHRHPPMLPRIVLIGSRGSGVTTQAQKLALKYGMVHVEFELVMARALQEDDELCKLYKVQLATRPDPELEAVILERALLTPACCKRGWVLTGYPNHVDQMRMLDIMATPPNRVIFIEVPSRECFVRLFYRKIDSCFGDEYKIPDIMPAGAESYETPDMDPRVAERLMSHPRNDKLQIISDIEKYFLRKNDLMAYCGKTASYIDGDQTVDRVFELIEQVIINPAAPQPPRDPLSVHHGIEESYERLKKFRLARGMFFNNLFLNPPEKGNRY